MGKVTRKELAEELDYAKRELSLLSADVHSRVQRLFDVVGEYSSGGAGGKLVGWVVVDKNDRPLVTGSYSSASAKLYRREGTAKAVASTHGAYYVKAVYVAD